MTKNSRWAKIRDDRNQPRYRSERRQFEANLRIAKKFWLEGYTTDDPWPGVICKHGENDSSKRIPVLTWIMLQAITTGYGIRCSEDRTYPYK